LQIERQIGRLNPLKRQLLGAAELDAKLKLITDGIVEVLAR
jgi:hypothetical protein